MLLKSHNSLSFCGNNYISIQWTSSKVSKWKDEWCTNILSKFQDKSLHTQFYVKKNINPSCARGNYSCPDNYCAYCGRQPVLIIRSTVILTDQSQEWSVIPKIDQLLFQSAFTS